MIIANVGGLSIGLGFFALCGSRCPLGFMAVLMCNADDLAENGLPIGNTQTLSALRA
jgi:hypothetical protein